MNGLFRVVARAAGPVAGAASATAGAFPRRRRKESPLSRPRSEVSHAEGFEALLGSAAWQRLPAEVRERFGALPAGHPKVYTGRVIATRLSVAGAVLARLSRLIGAPLPTRDGAVGAASVAVACDERLGGQVWTRLYARAGRFPQSINSVKRFSGPTGLEEFVGPGARWGVGMTLRLTVEGGALVFRSERYFLEGWGRRVYLPGFLSPGAMAITHRQLGAGRFQFLLELDHPLFGPMVRQDCEFYDCRLRHEAAATGHPTLAS